MVVEIYALSDPRSGDIRYIGKANDAHKRLKSHLRDSRRRDTPVYRWIRKLAGEGFAPSLTILASVVDGWQRVERGFIAEARAMGINLLNVADGGDEPFCPVSVRAANGKRNAKSRDKKFWGLMRDMGAALEKGWVSDETKAKMRNRPDIFGRFMHML
jgi:hypothetical protein